MTYLRTDRELRYPGYRHAYRPFFSRNLTNLVSHEYSPAWNWSNERCSAPFADILEHDDHYLLELALPGVVLDDIEIKVEEDILTVIAKRTPAMFEERAVVVRKELPCGIMVRHFEFDMPIIADQIQARMDRGMLFISVPKVEAALRIPVLAGNIESHISESKTRVPSKSVSVRSGKEVAHK